MTENDWNNSCPSCCSKDLSEHGRISGKLMVGKAYICEVCNQKIVIWPSLVPKKDETKEKIIQLAFEISKLIVIEKKNGIPLLETNKKIDELTKLVIKRNSE